jgi:choice-of-anchor B domain-containing protein
MRSVLRMLACLASLGLALWAVPAPAPASPEVALVAAELTGFGGSVLVGDGEIFVGEAANQFRPGLVYLYRKTSTGWQEAATLTGPKAAVGDQFGTSLALDGTTLFVGAGPTAVHVFTKPASSVWTYASTIAATTLPESALPPQAVPTPAPAPPAGTPPPPGAFAASPVPPGIRFGNAIAAGNGWLLVGKEIVGGGRGRAGGGATQPAIPAGVVFAFKRDASGAYAYQSTLASADAATSNGDNFGSAVAISGPMALIGASGQSSRAGVVHEFALDGDAWKAQRTFAPTGVQGNELFGSAIALTGDQAVVAAPGDAGGYGAAYVFRRVAQGGRGRGAGAPAAPQPAAAAPAPAASNFAWLELTRLATPAGQRTDMFATALAADDKEVWIGAPRAGGPGRVFVFPGNATGFQIDGVKLYGPSGTDSAGAGFSVSIRGNLAAVGAIGANRNGGGLLIYERDAFGAWREQPMLTVALDELAAVTGGERRCTGAGKVEVFDCGATDLLSFLPPSRLTHDAHYIPMSGIWGWTDAQTRQEWALIGRRDGATFIDITNPTRPLVVADMPLTDGARPSAWREIKVYKDHAYVVSDGSGPHGMQVFDLTRLRAMKPQASGLPQRVDPDLIYREVNSVHNIVINEDSGYAYAVGSSAGGTTCGGGLHMIDIREPKKPAFVGCYADASTGRASTGYSHDAQCVNYKGPDKRYRGREICIGSNETALSLADVTDKKNPKFVSRSSYPSVGYTHQGWLTDDHRYFYVNDELDEGRGAIQKTRTLVWDFVDLENPKLIKEHMSGEAASDHNLYVKGDLMYQANYRAGLRVLTVKDPANPKEIAYFDTAPYHPNTAGFNGAWSVFPFFKSGAIAISSIEQGLFIVRTADR